MQTVSTHIKVPLSLCVHPWSHRMKVMKSHFLQGVGGTAQLHGEGGRRGRERERESKGGRESSVIIFTAPLQHT